MFGVWGLEGLLRTFLSFLKGVLLDKAFALESLLSLSFCHILVVPRKPRAA